MKFMTAVASAALLVASQAYAMDTILPNALVATTTGQAGGREIFFTLPLNGDTSKCVVALSYGEKPGIGINNDGDTYINGNRLMSRTRTYSADGVYTFTAKAKSGCTGEAKVTFTVGNLMRPAVPTVDRSPVQANPAPRVLSEAKLSSVKLSKTTVIELSPLNAEVTVVDMLGKPTSVKNCAITASLFTDKNALLGTSAMEPNLLPGTIAVALTGLSVGQYGNYQLRFSGAKSCAGMATADFAYTAGAMAPDASGKTGLSTGPAGGLNPNTGMQTGGSVVIATPLPLAPGKVTGFDYPKIIKTGSVASVAANGIGVCDQQSHYTILFTKDNQQLDPGHVPQAMQYQQGYFAKDATWPRTIAIKPNSSTGVYTINWYNNVYDVNDPSLSCKSPGNGMTMQVVSALVN